MAARAGTDMCGPEAAASRETALPILVGLMVISACGTPRSTDGHTVPGAPPSSADIPLYADAAATDREIGPDALAACRAFRKKRGQPRHEEARGVARLLPATLTVGTMVDLLGEPDRRTDTGMIYRLGRADGRTHSMNVIIRPDGRASILGIGGGS